MLTMLDAKKIADRYIEAHFGERFGSDVLIMDEHTVEKSYGWIFFYQHRRYIEAPKIRNALIGNGPLLIDKTSGKVVILGGPGTIDYCCELYEKGKTREDENGVVHLLFREDLKN